MNLKDAPKVEWWECLALALYCLAANLLGWKLFLGIACYVTAYKLMRIKGRAK